MNRKEATNRFNRLYDITYDNALAYVIEATGSFDAAQDILAQTYLALYQRLLSTRAGEIRDIQQYFFSSLKNSIRAYHSGKKNDALLYEDLRSVTQEDCQDLIDSLLHTEIRLTEQEASDHLLIEKINRLVESKSEAERRAFVLKIYYGYPLQKVAEILDLPKTTVNNYIYRTLNDIRSQLLNEYLQK